ncbi:MAG: hypothetical protein M3Q81_03980 [bacterium]|nr:hypothetical protein [bacterium]
MKPEILITALGTCEVRVNGHQTNWRNEDDLALMIYLCDGLRSQFYPETRRERAAIFSGDIIRALWPMLTYDSAETVLHSSQKGIARTLQEALRLSGQDFEESDCWVVREFYGSYLLNDLFELRYDVANFERFYKAVITGDRRNSFKSWRALRRCFTGEFMYASLVSGDWVQRRNDELLTIVEQVDDEIRSFMII